MILGDFWGILKGKRLPCGEGDGVLDGGRRRGNGI